jgi:hypothetical protein
LPQWASGRDAHSQLSGRAVFHLRVIATIFALLLVNLSAAAHGRMAASASRAGVNIPSLSHGEMAVLDTYRGEILDIAAGIKRTDPTFRTLLNYGAIEFSFCLWGVAPATIRDEDSPFNECAHAYLAAAKALLLHMRAMPGQGLRAGELVSRIDAEMAATGAAFIGCQYSAESFNAAEFVTPHWENLIGHRPSLYALGSGGCLLIAACFAFNFRSTRRAS